MFKPLFISSDFIMVKISNMKHMKNCCYYTEILASFKLVIIYADESERYKQKS